VTRADTVDMLRRSLLVLLALALCPPQAPARAAAEPYRPDAWIKLCGQSTGCVIDPLPHPWLGKDRYNTTAYHQTHRDRIDNGEGIRYWITFQNDGTEADTYRVNGCAGTKEFRVLAVIVGKHKAPIGWGSVHITDEFRHDTATFDLAAGAKVAITLNIVTDNPGFTYRCPVTIVSQADPTKKDTVAAVMTSF
jgi:hypothetical protein